MVCWLKIKVMQQFFNHVNYKSLLMIYGWKERWFKTKCQSNILIKWICNLKWSSNSGYFYLH